MAGSIAMALAVSGRAHAQLGSEGLPNLSGVAGAITKAVAPKPAAGKTFSSGLSVPNVNPGAAAKEIGKQLREKTEAASGAKQPALAQLEAEMPKALAKLESELEKVGLAKRDLGVAVGYYFVMTYEAATGKVVPVEASKAVGRTIAAATAQQWGPSYKKLSPAQQEAMYEKLLISSTLVHAFATQFEQAGKTAEAKGMRDAAGSTFQTVFGVPATSVSIDNSGKIGGFATAQAAPATAVAKTKTKPSPVKAVAQTGPLAATSLNGAKVFVKYRMQFGTAAQMMFDHLILFPDGSAFDDIPDDPLPSFDAAALRQTLRPNHVGRWKMTGNGLALTFEGKTEAFKKHNSGGWAESDYKSGAFNVYFPVKVATKAQILGAWKHRSLTTMGMAGGGAPMVAAGSDNLLVFADNGSFTKAGKSFASATTANMGDAFKSGGDVTTTGGRANSFKGQWRLDGPLLTTSENGRRVVQLAFILPNWGEATEPPEILIQGDHYFRPDKK